MSTAYKTSYGTAGSPTYETDDPKDHGIKRLEKEDGGFFALEDGPGEIILEDSN